VNSLPQEPPVQILHWQGSKPPTQRLLKLLLEEAGHTHVSLEALPAGYRSAEQQETTPVLRWLLSGVLQLALPGYGVVELHPGDQYIIAPDFTYDVTVLSETGTQFLLSSTPNLVSEE
jgi:hypothetical protein